MINKQSLPLLILVCVLIITQQVQIAQIEGELKDISCTNPQKTAFISFKALSRRDDLRYVFEQLNKEIIKYDFVYNVSDTLIYNISQMHPQFYYNEHHQIDSYVDAYTARVDLGIIDFGYNFSYSIIKNGQVEKSGIARGATNLDPSKFTKKIISDLGTVEWDPLVVDNLTLSSQIPILQSIPKLSIDQVEMFQQMINDHVGNRKLKQAIIGSANVYYFELLKKYLNSEHMFANSAFQYSWRGKTINFITPQKDVKLYSTSQLSGLQGGFFLEIDKTPQQCSQLPDSLDEKKYGGLQEMISMSTMKSALKQAFQVKLFDAYLYSNWQVSAFQFRMGDLANVVPYAENILPNQFFYPNCEVDMKQQQKIVFGAYAKEAVKVVLPYICTIADSNNPLIKISAMFQFIIRIIPQVDYLNFVIDGTGLYDQKFEAVDKDKKFKVENEPLAVEYMRLLLNNLVGTPVFGTNWKTQFRRFPSVEVTKDYVAIFDVSQQ